MGKKQEDSTRKSHKKSAAIGTSLTRKQTELAHVFQLKCSLLLAGDLSYLEYIELRDEICRINALKEVFALKAAGREKH